MKKCPKCNYENNKDGDLYCGMCSAPFINPSANTTTCAVCGKEFELSAIQNKCPGCGRTVTLASEIPADAAQPISGPTKYYTLWEGEGNFFSRLFDTWTEIMFHPNRFFRNMPVTDSLGKPFFYGMILLIITAFFSALLQARPLPAMPAAKLIGQIQVLLMVAVSWLFVSAGICHISLFILGGNKQGFGATFRVIAYASSSFIFLIIPNHDVGFIVYGIWFIALSIIGFKQAHKISTWKSIMSVLLFVLSCLCGVAVGQIPGSVF